MLNITLYNTNGDSVASVCEEGCSRFKFQGSFIRHILNYTGYNQ